MKRILYFDKGVLRNMMEFLQESWSDELLRHDQYLGKKIKVSKTEWSSHQIVKPINTKGLTSWVEKIPISYRNHRNRYVDSALRKFGYSLDAYRLNISSKNADSNVLKNDKTIRKNKALFIKQIKKFSSLF